MNHLKAASYRWPCGFICVLWVLSFVEGEFSPWEYTQVTYWSQNRVNTKHLLMSTLQWNPLWASLRLERQASSCGESQINWAEKWFRMPRVMFKPAYFCLDFLNISFLCPKLAFYHQLSSRWAWCSQVDAAIPYLTTTEWKEFKSCLPRKTNQIKEKPLQQKYLRP